MVPPWKRTSPMRSRFQGCGRWRPAKQCEVHIRVVVGDDVAHPSHLSERQCGNFAPSFVAQVGCGFSDNFDAPDHGILFLRIGPELRL